MSLHLCGKIKIFGLILLAGIASFLPACASLIKTADVYNPKRHALLGLQQQKNTEFFKQPADPAELTKTLRFLRIFNEFPDEVKLVQLNSLGPTDIINLYESLEDVEQRLKRFPNSSGQIDLGRLNLEDPELFSQHPELFFVDQGGNFNGKALLGGLVVAAHARIGRILGCTTDSLQNGTCMPLAKSNEAQLTPEQKEAQPFKELAKQGKLTPDYWVKLLPIVDIMNRWFKGATDLWKIYFIENMQELDNKPFRAITLNTARMAMPGYRQVNFREFVFNNQLPSVDITILPDMLPGPGSILSPPSGIANVYAATLPDNFVDAVLTSEVVTGSPDTAIRVKYVLDDPYVRRQIDRFLHKVNQMPVAPVQVVVPEKTIDIDTKTVKSTDKPASLLQYYWARAFEKVPWYEQLGKNIQQVVNQII